MNDNLKLAELLFPNITKTPADMEEMFPPRNLKEGARVTRLAPSPTGFLHFGNLFAGMVAYKTAKVMPFVKSGVSRRYSKYCFVISLNRRQS